MNRSNQIEMEFLNCLHFEFSSFLTHCCARSLSNAQSNIDHYQTQLILLYAACGKIDLVNKSRADVADF